MSCQLPDYIAVCLVVITGAVAAGFFLWLIALVLLVAIVGAFVLALLHEWFFDTSCLDSTHESQTTNA